MEDIKAELQNLRVAIEGLTQVVMRLEQGQKPGLAAGELPEVSALTARQHAVLQGIVYNLPLETVAKILGGISIETVKTHTRQLSKKLGVSKRGEMRVMGQRFLDSVDDVEYIAVTGGFGKGYMLETDPDGSDELRPLIAPVKPGLMTSRPS